MNFCCVTRWSSDQQCDVVLTGPMRKPFGPSTHQNVGGGDGANKKSSNVSAATTHLPQQPHKSSSSLVHCEGLSSRVMRSDEAHKVTTPQNVGGDDQHPTKRTEKLRVEHDAFRRVLCQCDATTRLTSNAADFEHQSRRLFYAFNVWRGSVSRQWCEWALPGSEEERELRGERCWQFRKMYEMFQAWRKSSNNPHTVLLHAVMRGWREVVLGRLSLVSVLLCVQAWHCSKVEQRALRMWYARSQIERTERLALEDLFERSRKVAAGLELVAAVPDLDSTGASFSSGAGSQSSPDSKIRNGMYASTDVSEGSRFPSQGDDQNSPDSWTNNRANTSADLSEEQELPSLNSPDSYMGDSKCSSSQLSISSHAGASQSISHNSSVHIHSTSLPATRPSAGANSGPRKAGCSTRNTTQQRKAPVPCVHTLSATQTTPIPATGFSVRDAQSVSKRAKEDVSSKPGNPEVARKKKIPLIAQHRSMPLGSPEPGSYAALARERKSLKLSIMGNRVPENAFADLIAADGGYSVSNHTQVLHVEKVESRHSHRSEMTHVARADTSKPKSVESVQRLHDSGWTALSPSEDTRSVDLRNHFHSMPPQNQTAGSKGDQQPNDFDRIPPPQQLPDSLEFEEMVELRAMSSLLHEACDDVRYRDDESGPATPEPRRNTPSPMPLAAESRASLDVLMEFPTRNPSNFGGKCSLAASSVQASSFAAGEFSGAGKGGATDDQRKERQHSVTDRAEQSLVCWSVGQYQHEREPPRKASWQGLDDCSHRLSSARDSLEPTMSGQACWTVMNADAGSMQDGREESYHRFASTTDLPNRTSMQVRGQDKMKHFTSAGDYLIHRITSTTDLPIEASMQGQGQEEMRHFTSSGDHFDSRMSVRSCGIMCDMSTDKESRGGKEGSCRCCMRVRESWQTEVDTLMLMDQSDSGSNTVPWLKAYTIAVHRRNACADVDKITFSDVKNFWACKGW